MLSPARSHTGWAPYDGVGPSVARGRDDGLRQLGGRFGCGLYSRVPAQNRGCTLLSAGRHLAPGVRLGVTEVTSDGWSVGKVSQKNGMTE